MKTKQQGFSLVELMIAITIGIVLMTGVVQMFLSSKTVFSTQQGLSRVQETGRLAMEFLARDIREAGYMGCLSRTGISYHSTLENADAHEVDFQTAIEVTNGAPVTLSPPPISPVLTLRSAAGGGVGIAINNNSGILVAINTGETSPGCFSGLCQWDILVITDCSKARVFQATGFGTNAHGVLINHVANGTPGNHPHHASWGGSNAEDTFDKGSEIIKVRTRMYYVGVPTDGEGAPVEGRRPGLYMKEGFNDPVELLQDVENMHMMFGVDNNGDAIVDNYVALDSVGNWENVLAVRLELLVGSTDDNVSPEHRKYNFAGAEVTSTDKRIRQVFTNTVGIRSRLN